MILFVWGEHTEKHVKFKDAGLRSWRWALEAEPFSISVMMQNRSERFPEWRNGPDYYMAYLSKHFAIERESFWYDGQHTAVRLGFLHFNWCR